MNSSLPYALVFIGGGLGSTLRYVAGRAAVALLGPAFPYGTLAINVVGSFVIGLIAAWLTAPGESDQSLRLFLATGLMGGFTTYSAFSLETAMLWEKGDVMAAFLYAGGTLVLGLAGVFGGLTVARAAVGT